MGALVPFPPRPQEIAIEEAAQDIAARILEAETGLGRIDNQGEPVLCLLLLRTFAHVKKAALHAATKGTPMDSRKLRELFDDFNQRYFEGHLPRYRVRLVDRVPQHGIRPHGKIYFKRRLILLRRQSPDPVEGILLHEMAHAAAPRTNHGKPFQREIARLKELGAPLNDLDLKPFNPAIKRRWVEEEAVLGFATAPEMTCASFVKLIAQGHGVSMRYLHRRWPWLRKMVSKARLEGQRFAKHQRRIIAIGEKRRAAATKD